MSAKINPSHQPSNGEILMSKNRVTVKRLASKSFIEDVEESRQSGTPTFLGPKAYSESGRLGIFATFTKDSGVVWNVDHSVDATFSSEEILSFLGAVAAMDVDAIGGAR
ncbi:hypothetical protein QO003_000039 [Arthrobacter silviterrae]|uniref:hypothetical protein n=1 Tax=Arthrobacter silviterrae TaxID=2026658 RepID=UPI002789FD75|nr:hypothetical protein [Arthrobacter silviterrae]MDQ0275736.1 hypothetical protein [Arthrobacter silviterrae]